MSDSHLKNVQKMPESNEEPEPKLSPIPEETSEEQEPKESPELDGSSGGRETKVVHASRDKQEQKLSPIAEETSEEQEPKESPEPDGSSGGRETKVVHASRIEQEQKLSPITEETSEEQEFEVFSEPDGSSGGREHKVVRVSSVEQEAKLSPIPEETSEEQEPEESPKPVDSSDEQEPMEVLNSDDSSGEPLEDLKHEVPCAKQTLIEDANLNLPIKAKAQEPNGNSNSTPIAQARANFEQAQANLVQAQANLALAQANLDLFSQNQSEDITLPSTEVEMEEVNTGTSKETKEKNVDVIREIDSSRTIASTSSGKPPESDHICFETCIHGGAKPKTRSQAKLTMNTDAETSNHPDESDSILHNLVGLMERMGKNVSQNPARNISREEWKEKLENASYLTEEFGRPLGYRPIIQMPGDNSSSPYVVVHRQLERMFMSISLSDERKSETQPCVVTRCSLDSTEEASASLQELNITETDDQDSGSTSPGSFSSKAPGKVSDDNEEERDDLATVLLRWKISTGKSESAQLEKQDPMLKETAEFPSEPKHRDEQMEVSEEQIHEHLIERIDDGERDPVQAQRMEGGEEPVEDPHPGQEYRLIRLAPILPPINQMGPINPHHPYRERKLDRWRAAMMTAYRSERYHSSDLLDHTMSQLEAEGISRDDFHRLYHSTRLIDYYRDDGIHEDPTFSELRDMALEDRINQIIIAVGYMTVAMLYMRLQAERNPVVGEDSSESSAFDSGNIDSFESEPTVQYAPLREHVNIDLADSPESVESTNAGKLSTASCSSTSTDIYFDIYSPTVTNPQGNVGSPQGIQSPGNVGSPQGIQSTGNVGSPQGIQSPRNVGSPQGIRSPDIFPPISGSNLDEPQSVLIPLREVSKQCDTSSSQQSLLNMSFDASDGDSSSTQTPPQTPQSMKKDDLKRKVILRSCRDFSGESTSRDATPIPSDGESLIVPESKGGGLGIQTGEDHTNLLVESSLQQSLLNTSDGDSSSTQTPFQTPPQTPHSVKDDLRRRAILRSHRSSSRDDIPIPPSEERVLQASVNEGGRLGILNIGDLIDRVVGTILTRVDHSPKGHGEFPSTQDSCTDQLNDVGTRDANSSTQDVAREPRIGVESKDKNKSGLAGEVEMKSTDDQGENPMKEGTEAAGGKSETSESPDEPKDDIHMVEADSKTRRDRKRKEHSDSDDEFQQLPKRSHTEN